MKLHYPLKDIYITQPFGANPAAYYPQQGHNGIDYRASVGTPVMASADGEVTFEGWGGDFPLMGTPAGICIMLEHSIGWTGYAHLSSTVVNAGEKVKQGDVIGYSGATGTVTGAHLHFERLPDYYNVNNGYYGRIDPTPELNESAPVTPAPTPTPPPSNNCQYTIKWGDTLGQIAIDNGTTISQLMEWNSQITDPSYIQADWTIRVC